MNLGKKAIHENPCSETWENMEDFPEGKFCGICSTKVYDLSEKSLEKIESDYINKDVCVKMTEEQVDAFRYVHPVKRFAIAAFFIFGTSLFTITYGQELADSIPIYKSNECKVFGRFVFRKSSTQVIGKTVVIETETNIYTGQTDEKGRYAIRLPHGSKITKIDKQNVTLFIGNKKAINWGKTRLTINRFGIIGCPSF